MTDVKKRMLEKLAALKQAQKNRPALDPQPRKRNTQFKARSQNFNTKKFDFEVDDLDHCETEGKAYDDIVLVLKVVADSLGKLQSELRIYDPYYCDGAVIKNLRDRGFPQVYNRNEDFYKVQEKGQVPEYDVLVTNPPYSADHMRRMLEFCANSGKPWLALMPNYVYTKDYYQPALGEIRPFYITPVDRYVYWSPGGTRQSSREKKTSPFASFWYVHLGQLTGQTIKQLRKEMGISKGTTGLRQKDTISRSKNRQIQKYSSRVSSVGIVQKIKDLPDRFKAMFDKSRRRLRKKQRVAIKRRAGRFGSSTT